MLIAYTMVHDVPRFRLKAAAVHAAPVYMDKEATTAKVVSIIKAAGGQGIKLLVFPETFIPGYPVRITLLLSPQIFIDICIYIAMTTMTYTLPV